MKYTGSGDILSDLDVTKYLNEGGYIVSIEFIGNWRGCKMLGEIAQSGLAQNLNLQEGYKL